MISRPRPSFIRRIVAAIICSGLALGLHTPVYAETDSDDVQISVAPFVWAPTVRGSLEEGPIVIPLDASASDLASGIKIGGMVHADVKAKGLYASVQAIGLNFHDESFAPVLGADTKTSLLTIEALGGPVIEHDRLAIIPLAGARHTRIKGEFIAAGLGQLTAERNWSEGLLGMEAQYALSDTLTVRARGTVSVLGPKRQHSHDLLLAGTYQFADNFSVAAGYRWTRETVRKNDANSFGFDLSAKGPILGLVIAF